ncbi:MAG: helix-turn-helix transcriptional regulator [Pseudomonadota bacterium]
MRRLTNLKMILFEQGLTQRELARKAGIDETILSRAVHGRYVLDEVEMAQISRALGMSPKTLFETVEVFAET